MRADSDPAGPDAARIGQWYFDRSQYLCAAASFQAAHNDEPKNSSFLYFWGLSLERGGQFEASLLPLTQAARLTPTSPAPRVAIGEALDALGRKSEAEDEWRLALAIDPAAPSALDHLSARLLGGKRYMEVISVLGSPRQPSTLSMLQILNLGEALALLARLNDATELLSNGLRRFPDSAPLSDELATVQILAGQQAAANETLERTLKQHPADRATQALYLRSLISSNSEKAKSWADQMIAQHPHDAEILYLSADLAWKTGEPARAQELAKRSLAIDANNYKAQQLYGTLLNQAGDLEQAEQHMKKAIELGDPEPDVCYQLSRVQTKLGELEAARQSMNAYTSIRNADKERIDTAEDVARGDQAIQDGNPASAVALFRKALELSPREALLHYKLSRALDQVHDLTEERSELQSAIALDANFGEALNQLGYLDAHQGDPKGAEEFFLAAVKASPSYVVAWTNLAATYASQAKWKQAADAADHALEIEPGNSVAQKVRASILAAQSTP